MEYDLRTQTSQIEASLYPKLARNKGELSCKAPCEDMLHLVQIVCASTAIFLAAGRFGLTPSANRLASPGLKLQSNNSGLKTGDPAGFTATDVLYLGTIGEAETSQLATARLSKQTLTDGWS